MISGVTSLKWLCLVLLVFHNAATVLLMRYVSTAPGPKFLFTTAVASMEILKTLCALVFLFCESSFSPSKCLAQLNTNLVKNPAVLAKVGVPALLFIIQNNVLYLAISNMNVLVFQVTYQLKLLTTAVFTVLMFNRSLGIIQWASLIVLTTGVAIIQIENTQATKKNSEHQDNPVLGLICVLASCVLSSLASVYFEKLLKDSNTSIWMRNIQLGLFGMFFSIFTVLCTDYESVKERGFFFGYTPLVWFSVVMQGGGGLLIACVMKYADNILKGFAMSVAIVISCLASAYLFDTEVTPLLVFGTVLVITSALLYSYEPKKPSVHEPIVLRLKELATQNEKDGFVRQAETGII